MLKNSESVGAPISSSISMEIKPLTINIDEKFDCLLNEFLVAENNHIFNEPRFFCLHQQSSKDIYAQLVRRKDRKVFATIAFHEKNGEYLSPSRGTFGGFTINSPIDLALLEQFARVVFSYLTTAGAEKIIIKLAPISHDITSFSIMYNILVRCQFMVSTQELSFDLRVDERAFVERTDYGNAKRIRKCQREGFLSVKLALEQLKDVFVVIAANRARRGFPLSMSFFQLQDMANEFPDKIHCFAVYSDLDRSNLAAASVCIEVSTRVLYVFYWGDAAELESYSPIALLAAEIYGYCQRNCIEILDVGTSTVDGMPNYGLVRFKRNLAFSESLKLTMTLNCSNLTGFQHGVV